MCSRRRKGCNGRRAALTILVLVTSVVAASAGPAPASKGHKHKLPLYASSMSLTGHMSASFSCENWTSNWVFGGEYEPTTLKSLNTLDATARTASGTVDWNYSTCFDPESGSCSIAAISPEPGEHAGDEDALLRKAAGGLRVDVEFTQFLEMVGERCHGAILGIGFSGEPEGQGFIPAAEIGKKVITVPIAGSSSFSEDGESSESQLNGTLTLTRQGKK